jgi:carboxymethylenebutenolidase
MDIIDQEIASLHPKQSIGRRGFIVTALGTGFAAAVLPVSAQTITTDSDGLTAGPVQIPVSDGQIPGYRAQPEGKTDLPTILVVQEIFGVHEHIKDLCRRLAKRGYLAIAPELYARQGDASKAPSTAVLIDTIVSKVPDAQVMSDLDATVAWAKSNNGSQSKLAITGFCWGGRIVWLYTAHNPAIKAGAAWYGPLVTKTPPLQPRSSIDVVGELKAPVLGQYGGLDQGITAEHVAAMRSALAIAPEPGKSSEIIVYPDAQHGFNADYRPSYNAADAKLGWQRMLDWFAKYGVS